MAIEWEGGIPDDERKKIEAAWAARDRLTREYAAMVTKRQAEKHENATAEHTPAAVPQAVTITAPVLVIKHRRG